MKFIQDTTSDLKTADNKGRVTLGSWYVGKRFVMREESDGTAILTPVRIVPESDYLSTARSLAESFDSLEALKDNWDGQGSPAPSPALIAHARETLALLQAGTLANGHAWVNPHIGSNERGQITLEWWHGQRALTVFVRSENQVDYLKSWGSDIENEMEDGEISRLADFSMLSRWLYQAEAKAA